MKKIIFGSFALVVLAASSAQAQRGPAPYDLWCRDTSAYFGGGLQICMAYTYEQCMASRSAHTETCYLNPRYDSRFLRRN